MSERKVRTYDNDIRGVFMTDRSELIDIQEDLICINDDDKSHPWRRCSRGKHFVKAHILHGTRKVREHCAFNPSHKEELSYDEIQYITQKYFNDLPGVYFTPNRTPNTVLAEH